MQAALGGYGRRRPRKSFEEGCRHGHRPGHRSEYPSKKRPAGWGGTDPPWPARPSAHRAQEGRPNQECVEASLENTCASDRPSTPGRLEKSGCKAAAPAAPVPVVETKLLLQWFRDANKRIRQQRARPLHNCYAKHPNTERNIALHWSQAGLLSFLKPSPRGHFFPFS